jgi:hypothetical protein
VYIGYYQVCNFVLTDSNKFIADSQRKTNIMSLESLNINGTIIYIYLLKSQTIHELSSDMQQE